MSDAKRLAGAGPDAAGPGADRGPDRPGVEGADDPDTRYTLTPEGEAYLHEWGTKGFTGAHVPHAFRKPVSISVTTEQAYFDERVHRIFERAERTLLKKHKDYGPSNIAEAPGGALNGLRVRIHDKVARINHLLDSEQEPQYESLEDSFLDLANYAVIAIMVLRKQWPS